MGIHGVPASQRTQSRRKGASDSGTLRRQDPEIKELKAQLEAMTEYAENVNYFLDQFQEVVDLDREGILETAATLKIPDIKKNTSDRDILSAIFRKMREMMLDDLDEDSE